jgi:hypothetical protein
MTSHASSFDTTARPACGRQRRAVLLAAGALSLPALSSHAEVVDIVWRTGGRFDRNLTVAPHEFAELCGALSPGQTVNWSFDADGPLNFNIHHHVGQDVQYPNRLNQTYRSRGKLAVKSSQDYCWMWTNKSATAAQLAVRLELK